MLAGFGHIWKAKRMSQVVFHGKIGGKTWYKHAPYGKVPKRKARNGHYNNQFGSNLGFPALNAWIKT